MTTLDETGETGFAPSLVVDSTDTPHVAYGYFDGATGRGELRYVQVGLEPSVIDTEGNLGWASAAVITGDGSLAVIYPNVLNDDLKLAHASLPPGDWTIEIIDADVKQSVSAAIAPDRTLHLGYARSLGPLGLWHRTRCQE